MNRNTLLTLILLSLLGLVSCSSRKTIYKKGDRLTLQPDADKGIDANIENYPGGNYPNRNFGDYDAFAAVAWTAGEPLVVRGLLKFNLEAINIKTKIKKATLSLYAVSTPGIGTGHSTLSGSNDFALVKIIAPWDEHKVTWNTQPAISDKDEILFPATTSETQDFTDIDVTIMVREMIRHPEENNGFMLKLLNEEYYRRVIFGSSDNINPAKRPKLVIEF